MKEKTASSIQCCVDSWETTLAIMVDTFKWRKFYQNALVSIQGSSSVVHEQTNAIEWHFICTENLILTGQMHQLSTATLASIHGVLWKLSTSDPRNIPWTEQGLLPPAHNSLIYSCPHFLFSVHITNCHSSVCLFMYHWWWWPLNRDWNILVKKKQQLSLNVSTNLASIVSLEFACL